MTAHDIAELVMALFIGLSCGRLMALGAISRSNTSFTIGAATLVAWFVFLIAF